MTNATWVILGLVAAAAALRALRRTPQARARGPTAFLCSACMTQHPMTELHVLPWWNESASAFFTTFRCTACWPRALRETRQAIDGLDATKREAFVQFLNNHELQELVEKLQSLDDAAAKVELHALLQRIERGDLRLRI